MGKCVVDYVNDLNEGAQFPPIIVFFDGASYWVADGFHRLAAFKRAGRSTIRAEIKPGGARDAVLYTAGIKTFTRAQRSLLTRIKSDAELRLVELSDRKIKIDALNAALADIIRIIRATRE
jgi:ParB-like chromosome segregation protein Spo0J